MNLTDRRSHAAEHETNLRGFSILTTRGATRRSRARINAIVLHQMGFSRGSAPDAFDRVIAHFAILLDGAVLQLRDYESVLNDAYGGAGVQLEFEGDFPGHGLMVPTSAQIVAGRELVSMMFSDVPSIGAVYAHRHFNPGGRAYCPGPHVWRNIAKWAADTYGFQLTPRRARGTVPEDWLSDRYEVVI